MADALAASTAIDGGARLVRFTVDEVHAMLDAGVLTDGAPFELLDGLLRYKDRSARGEDPMTIGKRHNYLVQLPARLDVMLQQAGCHIQTQGPLSLPPRDEPEPDGLVLRGHPRDYLERLPGASDALVVFEVADSSLPIDRGEKMELYARHGLSQYVLVNIQDGCIEVYESPLRDEGRYATFRLVDPGQPLTLNLRTGSLEVPTEGWMPWLEPSPTP